MKKPLLISFVLSVIVSYAFLIIFFLASTDIYHDYVSKQMMVSHNLNYTALPEWTDCKDLWHAVRDDYLIRLVFHVFVAVILIKLMRTEGKLVTISSVTFLTNIVSFIFALFYFPATHDIYNEYVSRNILVQYNISDTGLANWTNCTLEWGFVQLDLYIRVVFMVLITVVLVKSVINYVADDVSY
jgi:hypothetical protein